MLYARTDPAEFPKIQRALFRSNRSALHAFSRIAVFIFLAVTVFSFFFGIDAKMKQHTGFVFGFFFSLAIFVCNYFLVPRRPKLQLLLVYLFLCGLFGFGFLLAFVTSPAQLTISLLIMFAIAPMLFTDPPLRMFILYGMLELLYIFLAMSYKPIGIRNVEIVNMLIYSNVGLLLGCYMTRMKLERFIFENRVSELTSQQQLSKYLKSISNIYVSMYHADLETGLFVELQEDVTLRSKVASMEQNFSRQLRLGTEVSVDPDFIPNAKKFVDLGTLKDRLKGKLTITHEFLSKDGVWCRARFVNADFEKKDEPPRYVIFAVENINEQKNREQELLSQAETDAMTGLYNRNGGVSKIKEKLHGGKLGMLCLFDVDKFKHINDTYGHQVGDQVIIAVADAMRKTFRDGDVLLRLGGDEYMVFLNKVTTEELGSMAIGRFFTELSKTVIEGHEDYQISVSLGATFFRGGKVDFDELYKQADTCTYESKKIEGRSFTFWRRT